MERESQSTAKRVVSLQEFRDRFPKASLLSEILMVKEDQFIVKVTIETQVGGVASGLAADSNVEIAEDRARQRAFHGLGLQPVLGKNEFQGTIPALENASTQATFEPTLSPHSEPLIDSTLPLAEIPIDMLEAEDFPAEEEQDPESSASFSSLESVSSQPVTAVKSKPKKVVSVTPREETAELRMAEPVDRYSEDSASQSEEVHLEASQPDKPMPALALPAPVNLSDVIAQTDIELRRLGWTVESGREYLEKTYNKRSRHELTEEELIQFLCYLESLSEPQIS